MPAQLTPESFEEAREALATWPYMRVWSLPATGRARTLRSMMAFVDGCQHDHMASDWDGRPRDVGVNYLQERMRPQGFVATPSAVVMADRKPNASYPIGRQCTMRFTEMLLGQGMAPTLKTSDARTDRYLDAVLNESKTWNSLQQARDYAGGCGSSAVLLSIVDGKPCSEALESCDLWVVEWKPGPDWIPVLVVEQRLVEEEKLDPESGALQSVRVWKTRAWDEEYSYTYEDVEEGHGSDRKSDPAALREQEDDGLPYRTGGEEEQEDDGEIRIATDEDGKPMVIAHGMGRCPVHWLQNTRNTKEPEGRPDMEGAWHLGDRLDRLQSMVVRASISNVDPTLVYSDEERRSRNNPFLRKGWGNVIRTGPNGSATFLETSGESIRMGWDGVHELRDELLATVGCVIVDPKLAGSNMSGEAIQMLWKVMEHAVGRKRVPLGDGIDQISQTWIQAGVTHGVANADDPESEGGILLPPLVRKVSELTEEEREEADLPPRLAEALERDGQEPGEDGEPPEPNDPQTKFELETLEIAMPHEVGDGRYVDVAWPAYHTPTPAQLQAIATALGVATGQKPTLSQETAVLTMINYLGRGDATAEFHRIQTEAKQRQEAFGASMFGDTGETDDEDAKDAEANADREAGKKGDDEGGDKPPPAGDGEE